MFCIHFKNLIEALYKNKYEYFDHLVEEYSPKK